MRVLSAIALFIISTMTQAESLHTLNLQQKTAAEMLPTLQPLIRPQDSLSGSAYTLYIRTDSKTLNEIKRIIQDLDKPPAQLLISLRNFERIIFDSNTVSSKNAQDHYESHQNSSGLNDSTDNNNQKKQLRTHRKPIQILATAGKPTPIYKRLPVTARIKQKQRLSTGQLREQHLLDIQAQHPSLYITAFLTGDTVTANIKPQHNDRSVQTPLNDNTLDIDTTVHGELGEWLPLKLIRPALKKIPAGKTIIKTSRPSEHQDAYIKFDKID